MPDNIKKPSAFLHITEPIRSFFETIRGFFLLLFSKKENLGQGQVVMVVPGLLSSDISTIILRKYLAKKGFLVIGWGLGINLGRLNVLPTFTNNIKELSKEHGQKMIIIGWSMGGLFCREACQQIPDFIKKVITIGSPYADVYAPNNARWAYNLFNKQDKENKEKAERLHIQTEMPSLSIYSKTDGIVPWQACMEPNVDADHKNAEVRSSHFGMGANPAVLKLVLKNLA
ncbi:MAG: alpha/beta fold hydrolase [Saprospiraceae bacterium]